MKIFVGLIIALVGLVVISSMGQSTDTTYESAPDIKDELVIGNPNAPVTLIEYADFKCPSCNQFHQTTAKELKKQYISNGQLKIVFRPLALIGPDSRLAAYGAYCANNQNMFSEYHDGVFDYLWDNHYSSGDIQKEFEDVLRQDVLTKIASDKGLVSESFEECLQNNDFREKVEINTDIAFRDGVKGTPTFKIGSELVVGPQPLNTFKTLIDVEASKQ